MLELNYRHSERRFNGAAHLLKKSCIKQAKRSAFDSILSFANISNLKMSASYVPADRISILGSNFSNGKYQSSAFKGGNDIFSNIAGPFNRSQIREPNLGTSNYLSSSYMTPLIANINIPENRL
jgi:hypothetical protein